MYNINTTPHERFFPFQRRSTHGNSLPSWLMSPGPVLLRRFVRNKNEPLVDEVELLDSNPSYENIRHPDGRETTVSVRDLAPCPERGVPPCLERSMSPRPEGEIDNIMEPDSASQAPVPDKMGLAGDVPTCQEPRLPDNVPELRRSSRTAKAPARYGWD